MPTWAGTWKGGRYYLDDDGRKVFYIERRGGLGRKGQYTIRLTTHDEQLAVGALERFLADPVAFVRPPPEVAGPLAEVLITKDRVALYLESIHDTVADHRAARESYLRNWAELGLDLRTVDRKALRVALASFDGGHRGRTEALNAFARFLVREGDLSSWNPLVNTREPEATRAEREAYSLEDLREAWAKLTAGPIRDLFLLRASTGMHHTELEQLEGARIFKGPLPDKGVGIRQLGGDHEIQGVLQVMHKSRRRHRQSVDAAGLEAALRLREGVPHRIVVWEAIKPLVPSNLRHTFTTLAGEVGELVTHVAGGVDRSRVAQALGHRAGSTMTADRYEKIQIPPMIKLPLGF